MLTDTQCRTAKSKDKPYKLTDGKGLYLEIKPNEVKAWRYRFELCDGGATKESIFAIGDYAIAPSCETLKERQARRGGRRFTLAEARDERIKARALVKQGINPAHNRQLERSKREQESATIFEAVASEWLALKDWEEITKKRRLDMLTRAVFPKIGSLPVKSITPAHRLAGGGLNADLDLQEIANELSISRRDVEEIYKQDGQFMKDLPRSSVGNNLYGMVYVTLPDHRRRGRSILHDQLKTQDTKSKNPVSD